MSQEALERFLGRLLTDEAFRQRAGESFDAVCREEGYTVSGEELAAISPEDLARLDLVAEKLDSSIKRFSGT